MNIDAALASKFYVGNVVDIDDDIGLDLQQL
jgi:hypothetical protein